MFHVVRLEFHILLFSPMPLSFVSQAGCLPMTELWGFGERDGKTGADTLQRSGDTTCPVMAAWPGPTGNLC